MMGFHHILVPPLVGDIHTVGDMNAFSTEYETPASKFSDKTTSLQAAQESVDRVLVVRSETRVNAHSPALHLDPWRTYVVLHYIIALMSVQAVLLSQGDRCKCYPALPQDTIPPHSCIHSSWLVGFFLATNVRKQWVRHWVGDRYKRRNSSLIGMEGNVLSSWEIRHPDHI